MPGLKYICLKHQKNESLYLPSLFLVLCQALQITAWFYKPIPNLVALRYGTNDFSQELITVDINQKFCVTD